MELNAAQNVPEHSPEDSTSGECRVRAARWVVAGGVAALFGSLLPFLSSPQSDVYQVTPAAKESAAFWAVVVAALGAVMFSKSRLAMRIAGIATLIIAGLEGLGLMLITAAGIVGFSDSDPYGDIVHVNFSPQIGIFLAILGCAASVIGAVMSFRSR